MHKAVQFGAGAIGRGFMGQLFHESGFHTVFADVDTNVINALNERGEYPLRIAGGDCPTVTIGPVSGIDARDQAKLNDAISEAVWLASAVGAAAVPAVCKSLAEGLAHRFTRYPDAQPLNIILCENMLDASGTFRREILTHLPEEHRPTFTEKTGLVEASIGRMVPVMTETMQAGDPLMVWAEPYCELPVDADALKTPYPEIAHMHPLSPFGAYVERKLFMHNAGHAAAAYLGHLKGHEYIWQAMADPDVNAVVLGAMKESAEALARKHGIDRESLAEHARDLARRFQNKALGDQVFRVARDPLRKLGPEDRLIAAARACLKAGIEPVNLAFAAAAAIQYDHPEDRAAQSLQTLLKQQGIDAVLSQVCGLEPEDPLAALIRQSAQRLHDTKWTTQV